MKENTNNCIFFVDNTDNHLKKNPFIDSPPKKNTAYSTNDHDKHIEQKTVSPALPVIHSTTVKKSRRFFMCCCCNDTV